MQDENQPLDPTDPNFPTKIDGAAAFRLGQEATQVDPTGWNPPKPEELNPLFADYEITDLLGRGGMGAVYKAVQTKLKRTVAIKLLPPEMAQIDPTFKERFQREAEAMAAMDHPNIVTVFDFGVTSMGHSFFVMEFVDGMDFHQLIHTGQLDPAGALNAVSQICDALEYAHEQGYVHRDIKPANIFINQKGILKVGDFGLAKIAGSAQTGAGLPSLTIAGSAMGTPFYSAPEQLDGGNVDHRADIYSLGVMFYEMLTREIPRGKVSPPSEKMENVDKRLDHVVFRAMESEPAARYPNVSEMRTEVDGIRVTPAIQSQPVHSSVESGSSASPPLPGKAFWHRPTTIGSALLLLILAGVAGWWALQSRESASKGAHSTPVDIATVSNPAMAAKETPFDNHLGMRFVPVPIAGGPTDGERVLFSIWETRVQDYKPFAEELGIDWQKPDFSQGDDHPATFVSWEDATAFCTWLTDREQKAGRLEKDKVYRLPTDHEWSCAVGIGHKEDPDEPPESKDLKMDGIYPWGREWPPPPGVGNLLGSEMTKSDLAAVKSDVEPIADYQDEYPRTAPVGMFQPNAFGLHDLSGNVTEWCEDWNQPDRNRRVVRGSAYRHGHRICHLSTQRWNVSPAHRKTDVGFRVMIGPGEVKEEIPLPEQEVFENGLGMRFVSVPIQGGSTEGKRVLFSVWETRVRDFRAFAREMEADWAPNEDWSDEHPAGLVDWNEAKAFCEWLTMRERMSGHIGEKDRYRLPSDHEWSCAVGIGHRENPNASPDDKSYDLPGVYPWGTEWPPPSGAGNFLGEEGTPEGTNLWIEGWSDPFPKAAPVASFSPTPYGLYDLAGNVHEWCEDLAVPDDDSRRVVRGGSWRNGKKPSVNSSVRIRAPATLRKEHHGFRCVLERGD